MKKLAWILVPAALIAPAAALAPSGCANTTDCRSLGTCGSGTGGAGTTTATTSTSATTTSATTTSATTTSTTTTNTGGGTTTTSSTSTATGLDGGPPILCTGKQYGDGLDQEARAVQVDSAGNLVLAGDFAGKLNFGGSPYSTTDHSAFVVGLDPSFNLRWGHSVPVSQTSYRAAAVDATGNTVLVGVYAPVVPPDAGPEAGPYDAGVVYDVGCGAPGLDPTLSSFVAEYDSTGICKLGRSYAASPTRASVAFDATGNIYIAGGFRTLLDFGCGNKLTTGGDEDIFAAKLGPDGSCVWQTSYGSPKDDEAAGIAVDPGTGNVYLTGTFNQGLDFGSSISVTAGAAYADVFVACVSQLGTGQIDKTVWAKSFHGAAAATSGGLTLVPGGLVLAGAFGDSLGAYDGGLPAGGSFFAIKVDPSGNTSWIQPIPGTAAASVASNALGATAYVGSSGADIVVAKLDPSGGSLAFQTITGSAARQGNGIAFGSTGLFVAGSFGGTIQLPGAATLTSVGGDDALLLLPCP